jgi:uncharacterized LabA/DUF88 family protein
VSANSSDRLAVLIDADNAQASIVPELFTEISRYGVASVKRAYGDWTTPNLQGWKSHLHKHAIQPVQQFSYTAGKNATDSSLIIDAMDLLHSGRFEGFCLVSSDSDFTRLATRIRESGPAVYGFGEAKTPEPFVSACDRFIFTEILRPKSSNKTAPKGLANAPIRKILVPAVEASLRDDGWALLSAVGLFLGKANPSFDPRNYGYSKLGELVRNQPFLELKETATGDGSGNALIRVRVKAA